MRRHHVRFPHRLPRRPRCAVVRPRPRHRLHAALPRRCRHLADRHDRDHRRVGLQAQVGRRAAEAVRRLLWHVPFHPRGRPLPRRLPHRRRRRPRRAARRGRTRGHPWLLPRLLDVRHGHPLQDPAAQRLPLPPEQRRRHDVGVQLVAQDPRLPAGRQHALAAAWAVRDLRGRPRPQEPLAQGVQARGRRPHPPHEGLVLPRAHGHHRPRPALPPDLRRLRQPQVPRRGARPVDRPGALGGVHGWRRRPLRLHAHALRRPLCRLPAQGHEGLQAPGVPRRLLCHLHHRHAHRHHRPGRGWIGLKRARASLDRRRRADAAHAAAHRGHDLRAQF
mmetsp:Transcript_43426/g.136121  ORF Transcript_43426/g.136121 Transcript_43426/m.136121 type:complete len:333 (+) Transcript_43426:838-1836(+)